MAKRKFYRSRFNPDRGWIVGFNNLQFSPEAFTGVGTLFDFSDVDAESLTGRIEQDKSDWFIKRVVMEAYAAVSFTNATATDIARVYQLGVGVIPNANADEAQANQQRVLTGEMYNLWARLFRTWSKPVYAGGVLPYSENNILASEPFPVNSYGVTAPFWGPSGWEADFDVSNAGLRNNQSVIFYASSSEGPASYDWDPGDVLYLTINWRVLVQKRRT